LSKRARRQRFWLHADAALQDDLLHRRSTTFRIGPVERREIAKERKQIRELHDRLEDGESIDSNTLDRALGGQQHVIYFDSDFS
jgi:hypothetical protein